MDVSVNWKKFDCEFQGEKISMMLRPLRRGAALKIFPYLGKSPEANTYKLVMDTLELQAMVPELLPGHMKDLDLTIDGAPVKLEDLAEESMLTPLVANIVAELIRMSFFKKRDEKNSDAPSAA